MPTTKFGINDPLGRNMIQVLSLAPLETILVRSNTITGEIVIDTENILHNPSVNLSVPVDSLDTGILLMNEVLRSDRWLDAARFPTIAFTLERVLRPRAPTALRDGVPTAIEAEGTFELHGASKTYPVEGEITWLKASASTARRLPGDLLRLRARVDLHLLDHGIQAHLSAQALDKVSNTLTVHVDLLASTQRPVVSEKTLQELARARRELAQRLLQAS